MMFLVAELSKLTSDQLVLMRARHVVEEIARTVEVAKSLKENDLKRVRFMPHFIYL